MNLEAGRNLGHYRLLEPIGQGGMGVVWKALDTTLDREVAVKVLPDMFSADPERLARFEREAKLLASLNHPGIATIHGFHEAEGIRFLAMELVQGADLSQRIAQGPLPIDEALGIATQVAEALEAAHESGVVHRDLKPANIQVAPDGKVKVLDFGLAKAFDPDASSTGVSMTPTLTTPATRAGVVLGTAAYMSPEQAKAKSVDRRTDIWAFGCVLYEMLCGRRPFEGEGVSEILAAVIMAPLDLAPVPQAVPPPVRRLLRRCLEKDPRRRLRDIGEARYLIEETLSGNAEEITASGTAVAQAVETRRGVSRPLVAAGLVIAAAAGAGAIWLTAPRATDPPLRRFELPTTGPYRSGVQGRLVAVSPDGARIAYSDRTRILVRELDRLEPREIKVSAEPTTIFWSPDSAWVGFLAGSKLWKGASAGGESVAIADITGGISGGAGGTWGPDGTITVTKGDDGLYQVSALGGDVRKVMSSPDPNAEADYHDPAALPDGSVLFVVHVGGGRPDTLALLSGGDRKTLLRIEGQDIWHPAWSPSGHILYRRQPSNPGIWALPFSLSGHEVTGDPFLVVPDGDLPSVSDDGTLVHVKGVATRSAQLVWVDRTGREVGRIGQPQEMWPFPALSPDGDRVAVTAAENESWEVWIHDTVRGTKTRLTFDAQAHYGASWTPDGQAVVFSQGAGFPMLIGLKAADGSGETQEVGSGWGATYTRDGRYLVYAQPDPNTDLDILYAETQGGGEPLKYLKAAAVQMGPHVSPDGRWIAYVSAETGLPEIYVKPFPGGEGKWQVSVAGGYWPRWSARGNRIYYATENAIMEVDVSAGTSLTLGNPRVVFDRPSLGWPLIFGWPPGFDVADDDQRFVIAVAAGEDRPAEGIMVVENWLKEFEGAGAPR